jgi:MOSC domain-containing protein YiiM
MEGRARAPARARRIRREPDIEGLDVSGALIGERWRVGTALLEVVQPRLPCFKARYTHRRPIVRRTLWTSLSARRVPQDLEEGEFARGDVVEVETALPNHGVTARLVSDAILNDHDLIPQVLEAPQLIPALQHWLTHANASRRR